MSRSIGALVLVFLCLACLSPQSFHSCRKERPCSKARPICSIELLSSYLGQGNADVVSAVSSGKLNAPSIAFELGPISNHGNNASVCG